eukprot:CAMPEP_0174384540 /NCGR_PEP_ID=MMETSP0811_2-20130205/125987_1 /TAXON_ID=73025 ORGANISM="Eutreptiella gymnastica-like, Strain CCMP1594" /NCGR_SAMPLE_ID=MMETSP0811_2 /ASSEMBLY_ACC=CAM_ASM_000667 /LENGTH=151 /DNA_ID=CAMNT_0015538531 /DNA_START=14 /DNA_END=469 /DNA_ORIENTATION=+
MNPKFSSSPFLDGAAPGEADRKAFIDLIGKDNINLWRWVKHLVSYTAEERAALPTLQKDGKPEARSIVILDINPWDAATDLGAMERAIRNTEINGLHWGASNLIPVADGISKLQIHLTIQDSLVSADNIEEAVTGQEEYVQSMDIVAWNKV